MKGGKEEEKRMDPMFPRLHINDAERRGPRAPPRNKMALSEQPAIASQSQRFNPELPSISMLPLPPTNSAAATSSTSSHAGSGDKMFSPFCYPPGISHPYSTSIHFPLGESSFTTPRNSDVAQIAPLNFKCLSVKGHLPSPSDCVPFQPCNLPYPMKLGNGGDFSLPSFHQVGKHLSCGNTTKAVEKEKDTFSSSKSHQKLQSSSENRVKDNLNVTQRRKPHVKEPTFVLSTREESLINADSRSVGRTMGDDINRPHDSSLEFRDEFRVLQANKTNGDNEYVRQEKLAKKRSASMMENLSCSLWPPGEEERSLNAIEFVNKCPEEQDHESLQAVEAERNEETSDASAGNSTSVVDLSPDGMVQKLGQKLFWKARRTILHQQRIFVLQIFELHRLIKVQKMVARSPEILFEDSLYTSKPSTKFSSKKNLQSKKALTLTHEPKADSEKPKTNPSEKMLPFFNDTNIKQSSHQTVQKSQPAIPKLTSPVGSDPKSGPWCSFQPPPGNQWLVPVRSPSEGLIYKPYSGPCPPPGGIMAPVYGGCRPLNISAYGMVTSHQPRIGLFPNPQAYFQPYPIPVMNSSGSSSGLDILTPFPRTRSSPWEIIRPYEKSCNISSQKSGIISNGAQSLQTDRDRGSDLQGSTASSPTDRTQPDALSLFPTKPSSEVIKVVPHNPISASESAARIFKSIQEERNQL